MKITYSDKLSSLMKREHTLDIVLDTVQASCWTGEYTDVTARFAGENEHDKLINEEFDVYDSELGRVYLAPGILVPKEEMSFDIRTLFWQENITVKGIALVGEW